MANKERSLAREFYERILDAPDKAKLLHELVNSKPLTYETEWLEFKPYPFVNPETVGKKSGVRQFRHLRTIKVACSFGG